MYTSQSHLTCFAQWQGMALPLSPPACCACQQPSQLLLLGQQAPGLLQDLGMPARMAKQVWSERACKPCHEISQPIRTSGVGARNKQHTSKIGALPVLLICSRVCIFPRALKLALR